MQAALVGSGQRSMAAARCHATLPTSTLFKSCVTLLLRYILSCGVADGSSSRSQRPRQPACAAPRAAPASSTQAASHHLQLVHQSLELVNLVQVLVLVLVIILHQRMVIKSSSPMPPALALECMTTIPAGR